VGGFEADNYWMSKWGMCLAPGEGIKDFLKGPRAVSRAYVSEYRVSRGGSLIELPGWMSYVPL
jgi:hypothetical protein